MSEGKQLSPRERRFVEEYLVDLNGGQAAIRAGYSANGSRAHASRNLKKPRVAEAVRAAMAARSKRTRVDADRVIRELERIAFSDIRRYVAAGNSGRGLKTIAELSDDEAAAVVELSGGTNGGNFRLKLHDKKKALDALARHTGVFAPRRAQSENPHATAERVREVILGRLARLAEPDQAS
ncbi:MAG TPA: terminase small subunit [Stellaceae bacterium]|nr:terminase small subunit [Stellaceae bacterium]